MDTVSRQRLLIHQGRPEHALGNQRLCRAGSILHAGRLNGAGGRKVAFKMRCIHLYAFSNPLVTKGQNAPVVTRLTPSACFPAIPHVDAARRTQKLARFAIVGVAPCHLVTAVFERQQIPALIRR